jgi:sugar phosphate isomerase/epimerase
MGKFRFTALIVFLFLTVYCAPVTKQDDTRTMIFDRENLIAWCIVPFDAAGRNSQQRALMLNKLGLTRMAWDWRMEHIPLLEEEINTLSEHNIELSAVWFWINNDVVNGLHPEHEQILETLLRTNTQTTLWVSFPDNFFGNGTDDEKVEKAARNLVVINDRAMEAGCRVALYNHMDWFGEPENQVRIIETIGSDNIGIVYNFHHGHHQIDRFGELLQVMMPYLWTININGMNVNGPKILDVGKGEYDTQMIRAIISSGYSGSIGIIGHTDGEDIEPVLERNLQGLEEILNKEM